MFQYDILQNKSYTDTLFFLNSIQRILRSMGGSMSKSDDKQQQYDFYVEDFKNTSDKLESTDKKCQFIIQLFVSFATITISVLSVYVSANSQITIANIWLLLILTFLIIIGEYTFKYNVIGNYHHTVYVNRMNTLRVLILFTCNADKTIAENYSFSELIKAKSKGMGYGMLMLLNCIISLLFITAGIVLYLTQKDTMYCVFECIFIIVLMICIFLINVQFYRKKCKDADEASEKIFRKMQNIVR